MLRITCGLKLHISGWCGSNRNTAGVEKFEFRTQHLRRALRLVAPSGLELLHRRARLLPGELAFAALAERQAGDLDAITFLGVQRDRAARAPDEIAGVRRDHQARFASVAHDRDFLLRLLHMAGCTGRVTIVWQFPPARSPGPT